MADFEVSTHYPKIVSSTLMPMFCFPAPSTVARWPWPCARSARARPSDVRTSAPELLPRHDVRTTDKHPREKFFVNSMSFCHYHTMAFNPPAVANASAQAALDLVVDVGAAGPANVRVTRSAKRKKIAEGLFQNGSITEAEYGDHEAFQARCTAAATGVVAGGGAPAWFGPALAAGLAPINAQLVNINAQLVNINARQSNAVAVHQNDILTPLNNGTGNPFPQFPATLQALNTMNGPALNAALGFYGLAAGGTVETRRDRFKKFIGIRL